VPAAAGAAAPIAEGDEEGEDGGDETPVLSMGAAALWLAAITVLVAACSEALTGSIEEVSHKWGVSQGFLGFIVLPIAGNACEHVTAVFVAMKNKMDLRRGPGGGGRGSGAAGARGRGGRGWGAGRGAWGAGRGVWGVRRALGT
jgi:hypothetical protein